MSARRAVFLLLSLVLWLKALTGLESEAAVQMRWETSVIDQVALSQALEMAEEPVRAAAWTMRRADDCTVATYSGDPLLLTGGRMTDGSAAVCAISESAARELWGSVDVVGLMFTLEGKDYTVGGVFPSGVADVLIAWDGAPDTTFRQMAVEFSGQTGGAQCRKALDFAASVGMPAPDDLLDAPLLYGIARMAARLPGWILVILVVVWQWRALRGIKVFSIPVRVPIVALSLAGMVLMMGVSLSIPKWLLPTRWSDFAHWGTLFSEVGDRLLLFLRAAHNRLNSQDLYICLRASAQGVLSAALLYDIRGGLNNAQNMDRAGTHRGIMLWRKFRKRRAIANRSSANGTGIDIGAAGGTGV